MKDLQELNMTRKEKKEVVKSVLDNLHNTELKEVLLHLLTSNSNNNIAYNYFIENHKERLIDSLNYNMIL